MKKLYTFLFLAVSAFTVNAQTTITQWNFDAKTTSATTGSGTLTLIGGITEPATDAGGAYPTGWTGTATGGFAYSATGFPAQGTASGTAGFEFKVSTVGYKDIKVTLDERASNTASKWSEYQYTTNGTTWVTLANNGGTITTQYKTTPSTLDFSSVDAADNNANFAVRVVTIFAPTTNAYEQVTATNTYQGGNFRVDNVTFTGTAITAGVKQNEIANLKLFPNPLKGNVLTVVTNSGVEKSVAVFDVLGKQVISAKTVNGTLNAANLTAGVYVVKITEEGKTATRKLIVQ
jgi:hypothetical protein